MDKDSIGNRMKENYENRYRIHLTRRTPVIVRLDGKAFHSLTRRCRKPFDEKFSDAMNYVAYCLCQEIQGAKCAYVQSDEISILLTDFDSLATQAWFDYNLQKMVSVSAGIASATFTLDRPLSCLPWKAIFDSRAFNIPKEETCNYFIWRQQDWIRNSLLMLTGVHYSTKQMYGKNSRDMHEMLHEKGVNWADLEPRWKNGWFVRKEVDGWHEGPAPIFTQERHTIETYNGEGEE